MMAYRPELDLLILVPSVIALLITGWALFVAVPRVQGWLWWPKYSPWKCWMMPYEITP